MHDAIEDLFSATELSDGGEHHDVLETYRLVARDAGWLRRLREAIASGLAAEAAVQKVHDDIRARMRMAASPYLRERLHDFEDLANRLLHHLGGVSRAAAMETRYPATEVLLCNSIVRDKIVTEEDEDLPAVISQCVEEGMRSFTLSLSELIDKELVHYDTAMEYAPNREALAAAVKGIKTAAQSLVGRVRGGR